MAESVWQRVVHQPQRVWLRRALFQIHLWSGIAVGLYLVMISITGSVLVYRNELYRAATRRPIVSTAPAPRLTDDQLRDAALRAYPSYGVATVRRARNPDQAVEISLRRGDRTRARLFDPRTGADLGDAIPLGIRAVSSLLDLHDNLLGGPTGRKINGLGALALFVLALTGAVIWWPGAKTWRRSLILHRGVGWKRATWDLHSMIGAWSLAFVLLFAITGMYLCYPQRFSDWADAIQPPTEANAGERFVDGVMYWLAYLHFGRLGGRGISWCGRGWCDSTTKALWATFGLAPVAMFATGAIMWWNRVLRPRWRARATPDFPTGYSPQRSRNPQSV